MRDFCDHVWTIKNSFINAFQIDFGLQEGGEQISRCIHTKNTATLTLMLFVGWLIWLGLWWSAEDEVMPVTIAVGFITC